MAGTACGTLRCSKDQLVGKNHSKMEVVCLVPNTCRPAGWKRDNYHAFIAGMRRHFKNVRLEADKGQAPTCDIVTTWGVAGVPAKASKARHWLHVDGAYLKHPEYTRVTLNSAYANDYINLYNWPSNRWVKLGVNMKPWRTGKGKVLIVLPSERSASRAGLNVSTDLDRIMAFLPNVTRRHIEIRPKVQNRQRSNLAGEFKSTYALITWNSIAAVEAAIAGIPIFLLSSSVAQAVANRDLRFLENPRLPDRQQWANNIAFHQWNRDELKGGHPWAFLSQYYLK